MLRLTALSAGLLVVPANLQGAMNLEELRAAVNESLTSMRSIQVKYSVSYKPKEGALGVTGWGPARYEWVEEGERRLFFDRTQHVMISFDGLKGYAYQKAGPGLLYITKTVDDAYNRKMTPAQVIGRRVQSTDHSLRDLLARDTARFAGKDSIAGHECYKATVDGFQSVNGQPLTLSAWIDPARGFRPRRIEVRYGDQLVAKKPSLSAVQFTWTVKQFEQIKDGLTGEDVWFPRKAVFRQIYGKHKMVIEQAVLNQKIPVSKFRPNPAEGTRVRDRRNSGG